MSTNTRMWFVVGACVWVILFVAAIAAVAAYYEPATALHYNSRISFGVVAAGLFSSKEAMRHAFTQREWLLSVGVAAGILSFILTRNDRKSLMRCCVFAAQLVVLPWGWLGLLMLPESIVGGVDGEWLAEHSPTMIAAGLWLCYALAMTVTSWDPAWWRGRPGRPASAKPV